MKCFAAMLVFCVAFVSRLTPLVWAGCPCVPMDGSACQIWKSSGTGFNWVTDSTPSPNITITSGTCGQSGESATAYIYCYLDASTALCDADPETPCGIGNDYSYARYAKIKVIGDPKAFQSIFPNGLYFKGCKVYDADIDYYSSVTITETNKECDLELSTSQLMRIVLYANAVQCLDAYSGSRFGIEIQFIDVRDSAKTQFSPLNAVTGSIVVQRNPKTSFDPLSVIPDFREGSNLGWIEKQTHDLTATTNDSRWKASYDAAGQCSETTEGLNLYHEQAKELIPSSHGVVRVKFPSFRRDMYGLPIYAAQAGWSYQYAPSNCYLQYEAQGVKIIYHCDSPYDDGPNAKGRYLIRRIESCTPAQTPGQGTNLWYINYTYNSPARIANIHNGTDPNDPNSATLQYLYQWEGNTAEISYESRSTTSGTWAQERQWEVTFDEQDRPIKYDAGCSSGCSGSAEFENVTYFDSEDYDLTGYEYLIQEKKDPNGMVVLKNSYTIVDYGYWQQGDWLPLGNMSFELPVVSGCVNQTTSDAIVGWAIEDPAQTPNVQVCHDPNESGLHGDQYLCPNGHILSKDFDCYLSPKLQYMLSASIKALDILNTSRGTIELYYDDGLNDVLLAAIDVNDIATGQLVNGQWEPFSVTIPCPESIVDLTSVEMKLVVSGDYVGIDNLVLASRFWVAGHGKPMVSQQEVYDDDAHDLVIAMTRDFDNENYIVTEKQYTSEFEYRITKYHYTDRTFSRLEKKDEFGSLSTEDPNQTYTMTYGGDDPNRIFITHYPSGKRADVHIYGTSGTVIDSYMMDLENDANSLRETYTYQDVEYSEYYEPADWRLKTHTNARGGITTYTYQEDGVHLLSSQSEPQTAAGSQEVSYIYDNARRVIQETRKLDESRNLVTTYAYNPTTGFLDSSTVNGATTTYRYNALGQVIRQTNPEGIMTGKSYGLGGELVSEFVLEEHSDPNSADTSLYLMSQTCYTYTDSGQIELVGQYKSNGSFPYQSDMTSNPNNWIWTCYEYYQDGKKKQSIEDYGTGRTNLTTEYFYNWQGELEKVLYPTGKWVKTYRDGRGLVVLEEVGYGADTVVLESAYSYDANGNLKQQSNFDGSILVYTYDHYDRLKRTYQSSTSGPYTEKFYNNAGDVIREIACDADGTVLSDQRLDYDVLGNVKSQRLCAEPNSLSGTEDLVTHYQYDIAGNLRYEIRAGLENTDPNETPDPNDIITEYRYNDQGRQSIVIDPMTHCYSRYYTEGGLLYKSIDPYDPYDPNAFVTENRFDAYGRLEKTLNPMGHYTVNIYNSLNQIIRQDIYDCKNPDNPNDDIPIRQVRTLYDNLGHVTQQALMADPNENGDIILGTDFVTNFVYEPNGLLAEQKTYVGSLATVAKTTFSYDPIGRRILTIDPENNWEQIYYNTEPALGSQVVKTEQYENDPDGNDGYTITAFMLYDNNGRLSARLLDKDGSRDISEEDPNTTFAYDGLGRITHTTAPDGVVAFTAYDGFGNVQQTIEDYGTGTENRTTEYVYNRLNQQYQVKAYDPNDTTSYIAVQTTTYAYNPNGLVTQITYPDQRVVEYEYNLLNKLDTETKRDGTKIYYWYDQLGNCVSESDDPDGWQSTSTPGYLTWFDYDGAGRLKSAYKEIEGQEISESSFTYNGFGARTSETAQYDDNITQTTYWTYDGSGNVLTQTHGDTILTYTHDGLGRIKTLDKGNDPIVTYSYLGRNTQSIDYPQADTTQQFAYDPLGRVLECKSIDANNLPILDFNYLYDIVGNRKQCAYSHLSTTVYDKYHYDTLNRLWKVEYGQTTPFSYLLEDSIWSMDELVLAASHWLNNETEEWIACKSNSGKRESTQSIQTAAENEVFISQRLKQMESVLKQAGFRNINSFLKSVKSIEAVAYNPDELLYTLVELGGDIPNNYTAEIVYNDNNQLIAQIIWNNKDKMVLFAMYPENGDTIVVSMSYDSKGNLTSDILTTFDANGNVVETIDMLAQQETLNTQGMLSVAPMSLDSGTILVSASPESPESASEEFVYDHLGNRYQYTDKLGYITTYTHNSVNQYSQSIQDLPYVPDEEQTFTHDENGNLSEDGYGYGYIYDYRNRLVEFQDPNSEPLVEYAFDALGRRISKTADSKTTYFFYDTAGRVIAEYEDGTTPTLQKEYVWGNGYNEILAMFTPYHAGDPDDWDDFVDFCTAWLSDPNDTGVWVEGFDSNNDDIINLIDFAYFADLWDIPSHDESDWYYLHDALGSVRGLVGGRFKRASDREFYNYDIYGKLSIQEAQESKSGNPYLFAGYRYDPETGLYHTEFRAYDAGMGRWLQLDPEGYVDTLSLYEYVASNPSMWIDPFGTSMTAYSYYHYLNPDNNDSVQKIAKETAKETAGTVVMVPFVVKAQLDCIGGGICEFLSDPKSSVEAILKSVGKFSDKVIERNVQIYINVKESNSPVKTFVSEEIRWGKDIYGPMIIRGMESYCDKVERAEGEDFWEGCKARAEMTLVVTEIFYAAKGVITAGKNVLTNSVDDVADDIVYNTNKRNGKITLSGHGGYNPSDGHIVVPEGTSVSTYTEHGSVISDKLGNYIELGKDISVEEFGCQINGAKTYLPCSKMPNYTLYPPDGLNIMGNPTTVKFPMKLSDYLKPNMGNIDWAACQSIE